MFIRIVPLFDVGLYFINLKKSSLYWQKTPKIIYYNVSRVEIYVQLVVVFTCYMIGWFSKFIEEIATYEMIIIVIAHAQGLQYRYIMREVDRSDL